MYNQAFQIKANLNKLVIVHRCLLKLKSSIRRLFKRNYISKTLNKKKINLKKTVLLTF